MHDGLDLSFVTNSNHSQDYGHETISVEVPIPQGHTFVHYVHDYRDDIDGQSKTWSDIKGSMRIYGAKNTGSTTIPLDDNAKGGKYFVVGCFDDRGYSGYQTIAKVVEKLPSSPDACKLLNNNS